MHNYFIKDGYRINNINKTNAISYIDDTNMSLSYQVDVYKFAATILKKYHSTTILDIGCGLGLKLRQYILPPVLSLGNTPKCIIGIDCSQSNINKCSQLGFGEWYVDDIENPKLKINEKFNLIISSDVIEHLFDPDMLLNYIKKFCNQDTLIIISTPERDLVRGVESYGPPPGHHIREWNREEFNHYLKSHSFKIVQHFLVNSKNLNITRRIISKLRLDWFLFALGMIKARYRSCQVVLLKYIQD